MGDRSRGRFPTPADLPLRECSPYSHVHVRRERLGFVHHSRTIFCRPVPNPTLLRFATFSRLVSAAAGAPQELYVTVLRRPILRGGGVPQLQAPGGVDPACYFFLKNLLQVTLSAVRAMGPSPGCRNSYAPWRAATPVGRAAWAAAMSTAIRSQTPLRRLSRTFQCRLS